jgi:nucleoside-diphosphate-sugar epimerase
MNFFISGVSGFFGKSFLRTLCKNPINYKFINHLILITRKQSLSKVKKFITAILLDHYYKISIVTIDHNHINNSIINSFNGENILFHFASKSVLDTRNDSEFLNEVEVINNNFFNFCIKNNVSKIIYPSSGAIYGERYNKAKIIETDKFVVNKKSKSYLYQKSKIITENTINDFRNRGLLDIRIARCFSFFGESYNISDNYVILQFIKNCLSNKKNIIIKSNGSAVRSYLYEEDLVVTLISMALSEESNSTFNVGSENEISILDLAKKINNIVANDEADIILYNKNIKENYYVPNMEKAKKTLGFKETKNLEDSICFFLENYKNNSFKKK